MFGTIDSILLCFCLCFALALQGTRADVNVCEESAVVQTPLGEIRGSVLQSRLGNHFYAFRGIRYAQAPIGPLRFKVRSRSSWLFPNVFTQHSLIHSFIPISARPAYRSLERNARCYRRWSNVSAVEARSHQRGWRLPPFERLFSCIESKCPTACARIHSSGRFLFIVGAELQLRPTKFIGPKYCVGHHKLPFGILGIPEHWHSRSARQ